MTATISFADWVDWLAIELTFIELYESAPPSGKREMRAVVRRLAEGIDQAQLDAFVARVPNFDRALSSFSVREQIRFAPQLTAAVAAFAHHVASTFGDRDCQEAG